MQGVDQIIRGDSQDVLRSLPSGFVQAVIADPPYFNVLNEGWDRQWHSHADYLDWYSTWIPECMRVLKDDGLCFICGQLGKRQHVFLHVMSALALKWAYHDLIIWDRVVGYNERRDSLTPAYEMVLVLRKSDTVKFRKERVRTVYSPEKIEQYLRDPRYKDKASRRRHLEAGKYARNILSIPSLRGSSKEKVGHPSQKPVELIKKLILVSTDPGDIVLDPFLGSGTSALAAKMLGRHFIGIERDGTYCEMAEARLKTAMPKTLVPIADSQC
jgi:site-specific DNA-methyltransferase (adenine-specific)